MSKRKGSGSPLDTGPTSRKGQKRRGDAAPDEVKKRKTCSKCGRPNGFLYCSFGHVCCMACCNPREKKIQRINCPIYECYGFININLGAFRHRKAEVQRHDESELKAGTASRQSYTVPKVVCTPTGLCERTSTAATFSGGFPTTEFALPTVPESPGGFQTDAGKASSPTKVLAPALLASTIPTDPFSLPAGWTTVCRTNTERFSCVLLDHLNPESQSVLRLMKAAECRKIYRIENRLTWQHYNLSKIQEGESTPAEILREQLLFISCTTKNYKLIAEVGLTSQQQSQTEVGFGFKLWTADGYIRQRQSQVTLIIQALCRSNPMVGQPDLTAAPMDANNTRVPCVVDNLEAPNFYLFFSCNMVFPRFAVITGL